MPACPWASWRNWMAIAGRYQSWLEIRRQTEEP
jgi:hypothetical protein